MEAGINARWGLSMYLGRDAVTPNNLLLFPARAGAGTPFLAAASCGAPDFSSGR
jgi:hypothetical protein